MKKIKTLNKQAEKHQNKIEEIKGKLREALQPYFTDEIFIDFNPSDWFFVGMDNEDLPNTPILEVIEDIESGKLTKHCTLKQ